MREIALYLDNKCNTNCEYCITDKTKKRTVKDEDVIEWIIKNQNEISFDRIYLLGGEPSIIYNDKIFEFITDCFENINMTTNLYDSSLIEKWIKKINKNIKLTVSIHEHISKIQIENIDKFKSNIDKINLMITKDNIKIIFSILKELNKFNIPISLVPIDLKNNETYDGFDKELLKKELYNMIEEEYYENLINFSFVEESRFGKEHYNEKECLKKSSLSIDLFGNIFICEYESLIYDYDLNLRRNYGSIYDTNIKEINKKIEADINKCVVDIECKDCKKCRNYGCLPKSLIKDKNHIFACDFYKTFYDYIMFEHRFKFNPERLTIFLTEKCNMRCIYCFEGNNTTHGYGNISENNIEKILRYFLSTKGNEKNISLFGGEPSLNKEGLRQILKYTKKYKGNKKIIFDINTNLYYLDDELKEIYKEYCDNFYFNFSISFGGDKEIHDKNRIDINGNGTYDRVINNSIELRKYLLNNVTNKYCKKPFSIQKNNTITYQDINKLEDIIDQDLQDLKNNLFDYSFLCFVVPNQTPNEIINDVDYDDVYNKIYELELKLIKKYSKRDLELIEKMISFYDFYPFNILNINPYIEAYKNPGLYSCGVGSRILSIRSNGDLLSCHVYLNDKNNKYELIKINYDYLNNGINMIDERYIILNLERLLKYNIVNFYNYKNQKCIDCIAHKNCHPCFTYIEKIEGNKLIKSKETCIRPLTKYKVYTDRLFPIILYRYSEIFKMEVGIKCQQEIK